MTNTDNLFYVIAEINHNRFIFSIMDPYLCKGTGKYFGKVIYSSIPFYGASSLLTHDQIWYKTAYCLSDGIVSGVSDYTIQDAAHSLGVSKGIGIHSHLSEVDDSCIVDLKYPIKIVDASNDLALTITIDRVAEFYKISKNQIEIFGSLLLFEENLSDVHDFDIIIPINSIQQAAAIAHTPRPLDSLEVIEYGQRWPLRWIDRSANKIICPFFIYNSFPPPASNLVLTLKWAKGFVEILDTTYGIFNMPIFSTSGVIDIIGFRTTLVRGMLKPGDKLEIDCPIYKILEGELSGKFIGIINNTDLQVKSFEEKILNAWKP